MLSSFPSVIVQISGTETDVIIAGLVLASIYLFWNALKNSKISTLYFSALAYALAIGTKTPALMLVLPVGLWMLWMAYSYKQKDFYKPIVWFLGFGVINFVLFASYQRAFIIDIREIDRYRSETGKKSFNIKKIDHWSFKYSEIEIIPNSRKKLLDYTGELEDHIKNL